MVFNSYTFIIFLFCVLMIHYSSLSWRTKKINLLISSYLFYATWNPLFVILLCVSTLVDWTLGRYIYRSDSGSYRKILLLTSLCVNLGILGFFKYGNFLLENFILLSDLLFIKFKPVKLNIILPVGISFYTFQTLSYTIDIYRKKMAPTESFLDYALFVTFFPELLAGPIVRAADFLPQCLKERRVTLEQFCYGMALIILGLFEKIVIADGLLSPIAGYIYDAKVIPDTISAWSGTLAFSGQIFCDFAGYSTTAIGVAMCLGFSIPENFNFPYASSGFSDFWKRWHISLSTWLKDYLYIPLGGNRKGALRTYLNLILTMLIGGLWHGASWTFVCWGGIHGIYLCIERYLKNIIGDLSIREKPVLEFILCVGTFVLICFTWVFFRADNFAKAFSICSALLGKGFKTSKLMIGKEDFYIAIFTVFSLFIIHWKMRFRTLKDLAGEYPWWVHSIVISLMILLIIIMPGDDNAFIYFKF